MRKRAAATQWTDAQIEKLKKLWCEGKTDKEIAQVLGLTRLQVQNKRKSLHLIGGTRKVKPKNDIGDGPYREFTRITDMLIVEYLADGYSLVHMAYELHRDLKMLKQYIGNNHDRLIAAANFMQNHYEGLFAAQHSDFDIKKCLEGEKELCLTR